MKQNIYDNAGFFSSYKRMREKQKSLNDLLEQSGILALLPEVKEARVLDLGCGAGELCRRLIKLGARSVIGVDISQNMLDLAAQDAPAGISFLKQPMEDLQFPPSSFDLVVSSLAFHYVADLQALFHNIHVWLKPGGVFLFSIEHPILTSSQGIHHGWVKGPEDVKICWPVDCYSQEGKRESHWFVAGVIKYHRTFSTIFNSLIKAGFTFQAVSEPVASDEDEQIWPDLKEARRRPPFLLVKTIA
ncbi:MAG TPA: class I SAM-dependent methyltransferase [Dehalococcoidales bacterium]|nr:class I SAM-dependent methyltransferase [Dehalococcoidales bacterium]